MFLKRIHTNFFSALCWSTMPQHFLAIKHWENNWRILGAPFLLFPCKFLWFMIPFFILTWELNFQALISYSSLKAFLLLNKINSFRNIIYPLELDLKFPTNSCWGQSGGVGFQCKIIIPVNLAGSFIHSFVYSSDMDKLLWYVWHKGYINKYDKKKKNPPLCGPNGIHKQMGRKQKFSKQFQSSVVKCQFQFKY